MRSMRIFLASRSPPALRARYTRSSSALSGYGNEPPAPDRRSEHSILLSINQTAAENMCLTSMEYCIPPRLVQIPVFMAGLCAHSGQNRRHFTEIEQKTDRKITKP